MKILKVALITFVVLVLVSIAGLFIFVKTFDINRFKPQILAQAGNALNRKVDFEKAQLSFSLRQGLNLTVKDLLIADDPAFARGEFLTVKDISLSVDLLGYIVHRKVSISSVLIDGFRVMIIRQKDGTLNVGSIAGPAAGKAKEQKIGKASVAMAMPAILVSSFQGSNGEVIYQDHSSEPPLELVVSDLNFTLRKISLTDRFPFTLDARVLSAKKNIHLEGNVQINLSTNGVTLSEFKGETDLSQILLEKIPVSFPAVKNEVLPKILIGRARVELEKLTAGSGGLTLLAGDVWLDDGSLQLTQMQVPFENVQLHAKVTLAKITLDTVSASLGQGTIKGTGSIDEYMAKQEFNMALDAHNIQLEDLIARDMLPINVKGAVSDQMKVKGKGFTPQALTSSLSGTGTIALKNIVLENINVFKLIIGKLSIVPGLAEKFEAALPERYTQTLAKKDTSLKDMELPVIIENGRLILKDSLLSAEMFSLKGSAEVGVDGTYAMEGTFLIPVDLSSAMVTNVPELQYLLNEDTQLFIPLKVSGKAPGIKLSVDAGYLAQKLLTNQATTQLLKVIDKALGGKKQSDVSPTNAQGAKDLQGVSAGPQVQESGEKKPSLEDIGKSLLQDIFKK